jgi:ABC-type antimicrobial peptide transport system permease subunit
MALGARSSNILWLVLQQGLLLVLIGSGIGLVAGLLVGHFVESLLYGVSGHDPASLLVTITVLTLSGIAACLLPAWRAVRINQLRP